MAGRFDLRINGQQATAVAGGTATRADCGRGACCACVIHLRRCESSEISVTNVAGCTCGKVSRRLAQSGNAVTSGTTSGDYTTMGKGGWLPGRGAVAVVTIISTGRNMCCRLYLGVDRDIGSTVTGCTVTRGDRPGSSSVAHRRWGKGGKGVVTGITLCCRRNVGAGHADPACRIVVTTGTSVGDWRHGCSVIEGCPRPCRG